MKHSLPLVFAAFFVLFLSSSGLALMELMEVSPQKAKELGIQVRSNPAGPDATRVELEFEPKGELKGYRRVDLNVGEGNKVTVFASLREEQTQPGHMLVSFAADRTMLEKATLRIVIGEPGELVGYDLYVRQFVAPAKGVKRGAGD